MTARIARASGWLTEHRTETAAGVLARTAAVPGVVLYAMADTEELLRTDLVAARSRAEYLGWDVRAVHFDFTDIAAGLPLDRRRGWVAARTAMARGYAVGLVAMSMVSMAPSAWEYEDQLAWCHTHACFVDLVQSETASILGAGAV